MNEKLYDKDFYEWTQVQSGLIKSQLSAGIDLENIAIEIKALGENQRFNLITNIRQLIIKLLELKFSDATSKPKLVEAITELRYQAGDILEISPCLYLYASKSFGKINKQALNAVKHKINVSKIEPLTLDQVLSHDYLS